MPANFVGFPRRVHPQRFLSWPLVPSSTSRPLISQTNLFVKAFCSKRANRFIEYGMNVRRFKPGFAGDGRFVCTITTRTIGVTDTTFVRALTYLVFFLYHTNASAFKLQTPSPVPMRSKLVRTARTSADGVACNDADECIVYHALRTPLDQHHLSRWLIFHSAQLFAIFYSFQMKLAMA